MSDRGLGIEADRILVAQLAGEARFHARWRRLSTEEEAAALAGLRALADGRADLLAEVAGIFEGTSEGELDEPLALCAAWLCRQAGADPAAIPAWIEEGRRRSTNARQPPFSGGRFSGGQSSGGQLSRELFPVDRAAEVPAPARPGSCSLAGSFTRARGRTMMHPSRLPFSGAHWADHVARHAFAIPDSVAIRYEGGSITWARLHDRVRRAAAAFAGQGVGRGDRVAVLMTNRPEYVEPVLAANAIGAIAVRSTSASPRPRPPTSCRTAAPRSSSPTSRSPRSPRRR
jgi:hypothetical protein